MIIPGKILFYLAFSPLCAVILEQKILWSFQSNPVSGYGPQQPIQNTVDWYLVFL